MKTKCNAAINAQSNLFQKKKKLNTFFTKNPNITKYKLKIYSNRPKNCLQLNKF